MALNAVNAELKQAKQNLTDALGDKTTEYWSIMKLWYRQKIDKDDFDTKALRLLSDGKIHLHNEFLVAIFTKCQTANFLHDSNAAKANIAAVATVTQVAAPIKVTAPGKVIKKAKTSKKKKPVVRATFENRFVPADPMQYLPIEVSKPVVNDRVEFCTKAACLPDVEMLHGRVFVTAWEWGLEGISDSSVPLVVTAVNQVLKNLVGAMVSRQSAYEVREGRFKHSLGQHFAETTPQARERENKADLQSSATDSAHIVSSKLGVDDVEQKAVYRLAMGGMAPMHKTLSLEDMLDALLVEGGLLASHTVSSLAMERILCSLWHPDHEQIEQDTRYRQQLAHSFSLDRR